MSNVEQWVEKFADFGARPSPSRYVALFDPEGTVFDSGMERPLKVDEMAPHMEGILTLMPDLYITVNRWRARDQTVFIDAQNSATIAGRKILWDAVYCVTLRGGRVIRGRRYYDRAPLLARVHPALPSLPLYEPVIDRELEQDTAATLAPGLSPAEFLAHYARAWQNPQPRQFATFYHAHGRVWNPDMVRPLRRAEIPGYYAALLSAIPDLRLERLDWAGDEHALYVEWHAHGTFVGKSFQLNLVDRFEFVEGRVIYGQAYFDTAVLLSALDPSLNAVPFALSAGAALAGSH
ncbi:MAG TPA: nuclear transport factor 2 family protein [Candidatus Binatia bacterium]|nr:nuclear transport factor 2 family protein [Candidatus Binatia bacterium]